MEDDLYSILGVSKNATQNDITSAYRRLSRTYHPDRRLDADEKLAAGPHWLKISAAYDVLADGRKRMVYDELGGANLQEGLALVSSKKVGPSVTTVEDLHREWRRAQSRSAEAAEMGRMGASGAIVISTSLQHVLQPPDPSIPLRERHLLPVLSSVAMQEEMGMRLDRKHSLTFSNQTVTKAGLGGSTLRIGFKRSLSPRSHIQLATSLSHEPSAIDFVASRRLSAHSNGSVSANISYQGISALTWQVSRQLTKRLMGDIALSLPLLSFAGLAPTDESSLRLHVQRMPGRQEQSGEGGEEEEEEEVEEAEPDEETTVATRPTTTTAAISSFYSRLLSYLHWWRTLLSDTIYAISPQMVINRALSVKKRLGDTQGELRISPSGGPQTGGSITWRHSTSSRSKLALRFGIGGQFSVTFSTERAISLTSASAVGIALQLSQRGLMTKLRIQRHNHRLLLPIYLVSYPYWSIELLMSLLVPATSIALAKITLLKPLKARRALKAKGEAEKMEKLKTEEAAANRRAAAAEARLLEKEAAGRAREEMAKSGLLILAAVYGDTDAFLEHCSKDSSGSGDDDPTLLEAYEDGSGWVRSASSGEASASSSSSSTSGYWLDVRIPLQYSVVDSTLILPGEQSKSRYRGFSRPPPPPEPAPPARLAAGEDDDAPPPTVEATPPQQACKLWVRYRLADEIRTVCVGDEDAVQLGPA